MADEWQRRTFISYEVGPPSALDASVPAPSTFRARSAELWLKGGRSVASRALLAAWECCIDLVCLGFYWKMDFIRIESFFFRRYFPWFSETISTNNHFLNKLD